MNTSSRKEEQKKFIFCLDLGQANDWTALLILERKQMVTTEWISEDPLVIQARDLREKQTYEDAIYHLRYIERMRNIPYPVVVERTKKVIEHPEIEGRYMLVMDQSGVGRPVYDLFKKAGLQAVGVTITGGNTDRPVSRTEVNVAKTNLVAITQVISQTGRLQYAAGLADLDLLRSEIANFRVQVTKNANEIYGAREGQHDDLILALAMGLWFGEKYGNPPRRATSFNRRVSLEDIFGLG